MAIPEFERVLVPSEKIDKFFHLRTLRSSGNKPKIKQEQTFDHQFLNPGTFFNIPMPLELEIGCGKGGFMVEYGERFPDRSFIGIDQEFAIAALAAKRIAKREHLRNTRMVYGDVFYLLRDFFPDQSVSVFHMYFPDPWPKKRHFKRRLLKKEFLNQMLRTAVKNAIFYWATDHADYHEASLELFSSIKWLKILADNAEPTCGITTNFEKKYIVEGRKINRLKMEIQNS